VRSAIQAQKTMLEFLGVPTQAVGGGKDSLVDDLGGGYSQETAALLGSTPRKTERAQGGNALITPASPGFSREGRKVFVR
jgi:hypothetical protein